MGTVSLWDDEKALWVDGWMVAVIAQCECA